MRVPEFDRHLTSGNRLVSFQQADTLARAQVSVPGMKCLIGNKNSPDALENE